MDPTELLEHLLTNAFLVTEGFAATTEESELAQGIIDLHEWIKKGGFLPEQWNVGTLLR